MRSFENEHPSNMPLADFRPHREEPAKILGLFREELDNLQHEFHQLNPKDCHLLDTKAKRLRRKIENTLKTQPFVSRPGSPPCVQMISLINQVQHLEQTLEQRPAA